MRPSDFASPKTTIRVQVDDYCRSPAAVGQGSEEDRPLPASRFDSRKRVLPPSNKVSQPYLDTCVSDLKVQWYQSSRSMAILTSAALPRISGSGALYFGPSGAIALRARLVAGPRRCACMPARRQSRCVAVEPKPVEASSQSRCRPAVSYVAMQFAMKSARRM